MSTLRHEYIIGDIQGCFSSLEALLQKIKFDASKDRLWFAGDLVARGEDSLATLRLIKQLNEIGSAHTVLGNHDLHLLAVWRGFAKQKNKDNTAAVFEAHDCDDLMHWLRMQPLIHQPNINTLLCHAGIPPIWSTEQAKAFASEVQLSLSSDLARLDTLLPALYGKEPALWHDSLMGMARLRCITNYFTRMRLCDKQGQLEFSFKKNPTLFKENLPKGFKAWYSWDNDIATKRKERIFFGHWASLESKVSNEQVQSTDAGCVWGGKLLAYRLADGKKYTN